MKCWYRSINHVGTRSGSSLEGGFIYERQPHIQLRVLGQESNELRQACRQLALTRPVTHGAHVKRLACALKSGKLADNSFAFPGQHVTNQAIGDARGRAWQLIKRRELRLQLPCRPYVRNLLPAGSYFVLQPLEHYLAFTQSQLTQ